MAGFSAIFINKVFQYLTIVVIFIGALLFYLDKAPKSTSLGTETSVYNKVLANSSVSLKPKKKKVNTSSLTAIKQRVALEAIIPLLHFSYQLQVVAMRVPGLVYFIVFQKQGVSLYGARAPGGSFITRIFPITIQPNAP